MTPAKRWGAAPAPLDLGDINKDWLAEIHRRMFHAIEHDLAALERAQKAGPDPIEVLSRKLKLLEQYFKVSRLAREAWPERQKPRRKRQQNGR